MGSYYDKYKKYEVLKDSDIVTSSNFLREICKQNLSNAKSSNLNIMESRWKESSKSIITNQIMGSITDFLNKLNNSVDDLTSACSLAKQLSIVVEKIKSEDAILDNLNSELSSIINDIRHTPEKIYEIEIIKGKNVSTSKTNPLYTSLVNRMNAKKEEIRKQKNLIEELCSKADNLINEINGYSGTNASTKTQVYTITGRNFGQVKIDGKTYFVSIPEFDGDVSELPLLLYLPGSKESGARLLNNGLPKMINDGLTLPYIVLVPYVTNWDVSKKNIVHTVSGLVNKTDLGMTGNEAIEKLLGNINVSSVSVLGYSKGAEEFTGAQGNGDSIATLLKKENIKPDNIILFGCSSAKNFPYEEYKDSTITIITSKEDKSVGFNNSKKLAIDLSKNLPGNVSVLGVGFESNDLNDLSTNGINVNVTSDSVSHGELQNYAIEYMLDNSLLTNNGIEPTIIDDNINYKYDGNKFVLND